MKRDYTTTIQLTELRFKQLFADLGNVCEIYSNGNKIVVYTLNSKIDNNFNLSYHLNFPQKNVKFNFWFDKICYLNSKESVTVSFFNRNEPNEDERLKSILTTTDFNVLNQSLKNIFLQYKIIN